MTDTLKAANLLRGTTFTTGNTSTSSFTSATRELQYLVRTIFIISIALIGIIAPGWINAAHRNGVLVLVRAAQYVFSSDSSRVHSLLNGRPAKPIPYYC